MRALLVAALFAGAVAETQWYVKYGMTEQAIAEATASGCYRGMYGGKQPRGMALLTCPFQDAAPVAATADDAFLCVVELTEGASAQSAMDIISTHAGTKMLWQGEQEIIIANAENHADKPDLCCRTHFMGIADNAMYVPISPIRTTDPAPLWHPRVRALHEQLYGNGTSFEPDPRIVELVRDYSFENVRENLRWLATGRTGLNTDVTRNSYSIRVGAGGCANTNWRCADNVVDELASEIRELFASYPGRWEIKFDRFRADMCRNLVLEIGGGQGATWIVTGAHLDSRNTGSGPTATGQAPGADDNASGSAVQLEMARVIAQRRVQFRHPMRILWFCGEEQGLLGSRALARAYRAAGDQLIGMFNMDMIGYTRPNLPVVMAFMTGAANRQFSEEIQAISRVYVPSLQVGFTSACCSDQQSFHAEGFRAAGIFETPTASVIYPQYHRTGDTWDNGLLNYNQIHNFGQGLFSAILEYAEIAS